MELDSYELSLTAVQYLDNKAYFDTDCHIFMTKSLEETSFDIVSLN